MAPDSRQYFGWDIFSNISEGTAFANLKYGKYDMTNKKTNNNKRLIDRARTATSNDEKSNVKI